MGHAHIVIIDDNREHISRRPVAAKQNKVIKRFIFDPHRALHKIVYYALAFKRAL